MFLAEILNLYNLSDNPEDLPGYNERDNVPAFAWGKYFRSGNPESYKKMRSLEHIWAKEPKYAWLYVVNVIGTAKDHPEIEAAIARDPQTAVDYAKIILKGPFPLGEPAIATQFYSSLRYAGATHKPFPPFEDELARSAPIHILQYCEYIGQRFPKGEPLLLKEASVNSLAGYAYEMIGGRWPEAEDIIAGNQSRARDATARDHYDLRRQCAEASMDYAVEVMNGPFIKGEEVISEFADLALRYMERMYGRKIGTVRSDMQWFNAMRYNRDAKLRTGG